MPESPISPERVVIAGGTGFLGLNLARCLSDRGVEVTLVSRHAPGEGPWRHMEWDGRTIGAWAECLEGAQAIVNLAGRSVDCVKTPDHCDEILRSRVDSTLALGRALAGSGELPEVWVQMSTAHIHGDPPMEVMEEGSPPGYGLAPFVARAWEDAFARSLPEGVRPVILRTSFVLGRDGGALRRLALLARLGLGGKVGCGKQGISWLHEEDMNLLFLRALARRDMRGVYLATAPHPVSNREFMRELRRAVGMPVGLPAAEWMVRLAAPLLLRTDPELALYGRYCRPARLLEEGHRFRFPDLSGALRDLYRRG